MKEKNKQIIQAGGTEVIKRDSFLEKIIKKAEKEMGQGHLRFVNKEIKYYNPKTKTYVLFGRVGPKITYVLGQGDVMEEHMTWPERYYVFFRGIKETSNKLIIRQTGQYEGYGEMMYEAEDIIFKKGRKK